MSIANCSAGLGKTTGIGFYDVTGNTDKRIDPREIKTKFPFRCLYARGLANSLISQGNEAE